MRKHAILLLEGSRSIGDFENEAKAIIGIGITHSLKREYKLAIEHFTLAKDISEKIDFKVMTAKCYMNLGSVFNALFNYESALSQYLKILKQYGDIIDERMKGLIYHNLGGAYLGLNQGTEAVKSFKNGLEICKQHKIYKLQAVALYELSSYYAKNQKISKALKYSRELEEVFKLTPIEFGEEIHLANLGRIAFYQKEYDKAEMFGLKSLEKCKQAKNYKTKNRVHILLYETYKAILDYEKALHYHELYNKNNEEFLKEMNRRQTIDLELRYETKEKEKEIKLLKTQMEYKELELEHTKKIVAQNDLIQRANEELKQFTYAVSHDLKEPLRMIGSFSKLVQRRLKKDLDQSTKEYFDFITGGVVRMEAMLNGLLEYAYIGKHTNLNQVIDLNQVVQDVLLNLKLRIDETQATVEVERLPEIESNKTLIAQLIQNLIANALKFKHPNINPKILIDYEEKDEFYIIRVKDNGIGIAPENQQRIFDLFSRVHARSKYEGTGIGLTMCKKITQIIGGEIWLSSEVNQGSVFYFSVPKALL